MRGFESKEARYLIYAVVALIILALFVIAVRISRRPIAQNSLETDQIAPHVDLIIPPEYAQAVPLEWIPLIDIEAGIPQSVIRRFKTEPSDIDLDSLRRNTDEIMEKSFEDVQ